jgi:hypothetical protein
VQDGRNLADLFPYAVAAVGGIATFAGLRMLRLAWASTRWPTAPGIVLEAWVQEIYDHEWNRVNRPRIRYRYTVGAKQYEGDRLDFYGALPTELPPPGKLVLRGLVEDAVCRVSYDPKHPSRSCLFPRVHWQLFLLPSMGAFFLLWGILELLDPASPW